MSSSCPYCPPDTPNEAWGMSSEGFQNMKKIHDAKHVLSQTEDWNERMELARIRCSEVIDLDREPPVKHINIRAKTALQELEDLDKLHSSLLKQRNDKLREEIVRLSKTEPPIDFREKVLSLLDRKEKL